MVAARASAVKSNARIMDAKPNPRIRLLMIFPPRPQKPFSANGVSEPTTEGEGDCNHPRTTDQAENPKIAVQFGWTISSASCRRSDASCHSLGAAKRSVSAVGFIAAGDAPN